MEWNEPLGWLWLAQVMGPGTARARDIIDVYGGPRSVYEARLKEDFSPWLTGQQLERLHSMTPESCMPMWEKCRRAGISVLMYGGEGYPKKLLGLEDAPLVLYATGTPQVLAKGPVIGLVGSRRPSAYGIEAAQQLSRACAKAGAVLISGLADGLDSEAHKAAVEEKTPTAAFLGVDISRTYPAANRPLRARIEQNGAVFSEYGFGEGGRSSHFLQRNRLIAACCDVLCVVEARRQSGTMSTVRHALRYGRPVYAVPGSIFSAQSEGTNLLIAQNQAKAVTGPGQLLQALGLQETPGCVKTEEKAPIDALQRAIRHTLTDGPKTLSQLGVLLKQEPGALLSSLTRMEIAGLVSCAGGLYTNRK